MNGTAEKKTKTVTQPAAVVFFFGAVKSIGQIESLRTNPDGFVHSVDYLDATLIKLAGGRGIGGSVHGGGFERGILRGTGRGDRLASVFFAREKLRREILRRNVRKRSGDGEEKREDGLQFTRTRARPRLTYLQRGRTLARTSRITHRLVTHIQLIFR